MHFVQSTDVTIANWKKVYILKRVYCNKDMKTGISNKLIVLKQLLVFPSYYFICFKKFCFNRIDEMLFLHFSRKIM